MQLSIKTGSYYEGFHSHKHCACFAYFNDCLPLLCHMATGLCKYISLKAQGVKITFGQLLPPNHVPPTGASGRNYFTCSLYMLCTQKANTFIFHVCLQSYCNYNFTNIILVHSVSSIACVSFSSAALRERRNCTDYKTPRGQTVFLMFFWCFFLTCLDIEKPSV